VLYEGFSATRQQYFGGSAAQSALLPLLDIALGVRHDSGKSRNFLLAMREYMLKPHREFLAYLEGVANIRTFVTEMRAQYVLPRGPPPHSAEPTTHPPSPSTSTRVRAAVQGLVEAYDRAVSLLRDFRTAHMALVADYIMAQQQRGARTVPPSPSFASTETPVPTASSDRTDTRGGDEISAEFATVTSPAPRRSTSSVSVGSTIAAPVAKRNVPLENSAGGKGTGGTDLMNFLRPIRDDCKAR